jgi:ABC-type nitrate/sulfonate/bicarbonate transport system permease component
MSKRRSTRGSLSGSPSQAVEREKSDKRVSVKDPVATSRVAPDARRFARKRRRRRSAGADQLSWAISGGTVGLLLLLWVVITSAGWLQDLPSPGQLVDAFRTAATDGYAGTLLLGHVWASLRRALSGLLLGIVLGVPSGLLLGYFPRINAAFGPIFSFIRPIPALAFIPLVILYMGIGESSKVLVVFIPAFLYMVLNTSAGVRSVPSNYILAGQNIGLSRTTLFRRIILPSSMPFVITGLKTSLALSWAVIVAAELVAAQRGLGFIILDAATYYRIPDLYLGILLIGLILELVVNALERRTLHWVKG